MNWFSLFVAICLAQANAGFLEDKCEVFKILEGDIHGDFIHLFSLRNKNSDGEIFRYKFFYNYTGENYSMKMFFTKSSNLKALDEQNNYWVLDLSDYPDTNVGYSALTDQNNKFIDKTDYKLKLYGEHFVAFDVVLTDERILKIEQPGKKEPYLTSKEIQFPWYGFAALQFSGGSADFFFDCQNL